MEVDGDLKTILTEQRRELMTDQETDNDLSYAYQLQLQLQEATKASINSSGSSADVTGKPNPNPVPVPVPVPNDGVSIFHILSEELSNYKQQLLDPETSLAEMKKVQDGLNLWANDQAFASERQSVPKEEWYDTGDHHFQKAFGEELSKKLVTDEEKTVYRPADEKVYCPYRCSYLMSGKEIQVLTGCSRRGDSGARNCLKCGRMFCIYCKVPWHTDMTCPEYKKMDHYFNTEYAKFISTTWQQCPECYHMVSLAQGCNHIYCRCGCEFCHTCGAIWVNQKATCKCPDERKIINE